MSRDKDKLLQECLAGLDAGLTPEECLSAYPSQRDELEPMLRQAMLLRVAFAGSPKEDFKLRAREKLMFAAGREASQALAAQPDEHFVRSTRQRFLNAAGATTQEALRNVPPPRLAFWMNARRRLLDSAAARAAARPAPRSMALAFPTAYSAAAVLVLAVAVAGLAYFSAQPGGTSVSAEFASIEQQISEVEAQRGAGLAVPNSVLVDLTQKTVAAVEKINLEQAPPQLSAKAEELIGRQMALVTEAATESPGAPMALQQAQQQLQRAEEQVRVLNLRADTPLVPATPVATVASGQAPSTATQPAAASASAGSATTVPASATATPGPLGPGEVRLVLLSTDSSFGLTWTEVITQHLRIAMPANWELVGVTFDATGLGKHDASRLTIVAPNRQVSVSVSLTTGEMSALVNNVQFPLRTEGGAVLPVTELVLRAGEYADEFSHMVETLQYAPPATPTPSATAPATSSPAPQPSSTTTP